MVRAALQSGTAHRRAVFEMFARHLPNGRRYGVVAGTGRLLDALEEFRFGDAELEFLERDAESPTARRLTSSGTTSSAVTSGAMPRATATSPARRSWSSKGTFAEAVILETLALSIFNHDCAIASAASRMVMAAHGRPLVEMGSRRTHERAAVASARAAYIAGFTTTSNLRAGYQLRTSRPAARARTRSRCCTMARARPSPRRSMRSARARRCSSTLTTFPARSAPRSSRPVPSSARSASTAATWPLWRREARAAARCAGRHQDQDRADRRSGRVLDSSAGRRARRRIRGWHLAGHRIGRAHCGAGLQARREGGHRWSRPAAPGREAFGRQAFAWRAQVGDAAARRVRIRDRRSRHRLRARRC